MLEDWRRDYNEERPHSKLGWLTPQAYADALSRRAVGRAALRCPRAPRPGSCQPPPTRLRSTPDSRYDWMRNGGHVNPHPGSCRSPGPTLQALASQAAGFAHSLAARSSGTSWPPCPAQPEHPRRLPATVPLQKNKPPDRRVRLHDKHPQAFPDQIRAVRLSLAGFYAARSRITPPLQWPTLSPPRT